MEALLANKALVYGVIGGVVVLGILLKSIVSVPEGSVAIIARFGKYKRDFGPGLKFKIPFIERVDGKISMKENMVKFPILSTTTKDKVPVKPELIAYFKVVTPHVYFYRIDDSGEFLEGVLEAVLRDTINSMTVEETVSSREVIKQKLLGSLENSEENWGIQFTRIEIKDIDLPTQIKLTLEEKAKEELIMRSEIAKAEAEKAAAIIKAEGEAEAIKIVRKAHTERRAEAEPEIHIPRVAYSEPAVEYSAPESFEYEEDYLDESDYR